MSAPPRALNPAAPRPGTTARSGTEVASRTAACTSDALHRDTDHVVLFTDLANPTSNAIYQHIGYQPVRDHKVVHFGA